MGGFLRGWREKQEEKNKIRKICTHFERFSHKLINFELFKEKKLDFEEFWGFLNKLKILN